MSLRPSTILPPPMVGSATLRITEPPVSVTWRAIVETTVPTVYPGQRACR